MKRSSSRKSASSVTSTFPPDEPVIKEATIPEVVRPQLEYTVPTTSVAKINQLEDAEAIAADIAQLFNLVNCETSMSDAGLLDQYCGLYWHTRKQQYPVWLQTYALTMLSELVADIRKGSSHESVCSTFKQLAKQLAESEQAHSVSQRGPPAFSALLGMCNDLVQSLRASVLDSYELLSFFLTEPQDIAISKHVGHMFDLHPERFDNEPKTFPPILQLAMPVRLIERASRNVEVDQPPKKTDKKTAATPVSDKKTKDATGKAKASGQAAAAKPLVRTKDEKKARLGALLGRFSAMEIKDITASVTKEVLEEFEQSVKATIADSQDKIAKKLPNLTR
eukprot:scpid43623/ scgid30494/ 